MLAHTCDHPSAPASAHTFARKPCPARRSSTPGKRAGKRLSACLLACLLACLPLTLCGCLDDESTFTQGRLEDPCNGSIPICRTQAACVLEQDEYFRGTFPGGVRKIVRNDTDKTTLVVRILLTEPLFPGTELLIQAYSPGCGQFKEAHVQDIDLFNFAGDDRTMEFQLDLEGQGDHLLEIFSDMSSDYILAILLEERGA